MTNIDELPPLSDAIIEFLSTVYPDRLPSEQELATEAIIARKMGQQDVIRALWQIYAIQNPAPGDV